MLPYRRLKCRSFDHRQHLKNVTTGDLGRWDYRRCSRLCWTFNHPQRHPADTDSEPNKSRARTPRHATTRPVEGDLLPSLEEPPVQNRSALIRDFGVKSHTANSSIWHMWTKNTACLRTGGWPKWIGQWDVGQGSARVACSRFWLHCSKLVLTETRQSQTSSTRMPLCFRCFEAPAE